MNASTAADRIFAMFFLSLGAIGIFYGLNLSFIMALIPILVSIVLIVLSSVVIIKPHGKKVFESFPRFILFLAACLLTVFSMDIIGYFLALAIFIAIACIIFNMRRPFQIGLIILVFEVISYVIFYRLLKIPFPTYF